MFFLERKGMFFVINSMFFQSAATANIYWSASSEQSSQHQHRAPALVKK